MSLFIAIEYPEISGREALKLSMKITDGYKWDIFLWDYLLLDGQFYVFFTLGLFFMA